MHDITPDRVVADVLTAAGYDVVRCAEPDAPDFPCAGAFGSCPLDGSVDVAVVVHDRPAVDLAHGEIGVVCALRDAVPVVVAGNHTQSAFGARCDAVANSVGDVPAACRWAIAAAAHRASDFVSIFAGVSTTVERRGHVVTVRLAPDATAAQAELASRATSRMYPSARTIDVAPAHPAVNPIME